MKELEKAAIQMSCYRKEITSARRTAGKVTVFPFLHVPRQETSDVTWSDDEDTIIIMITNLQSTGLECFLGKIMIQDRLEGIEQTLAEHHDDSPQ